MKKIKTSRGVFALVDNDDYAFLSSMKWYCSAQGYAVNPNNEYRSMHRALFGFKANESSLVFVDHINGIKHDNRRKNLRLVDKHQNQQNRKLAVNNTSGYKGVAFMKSKNKWWSKITVNKKRKFLGYFETAKEAGVAYNKAAKKYFGEYALLNRIGE